MCPRLIIADLLVRLGTWIRKVRKQVRLDCWTQVVMAEKVGIDRSFLRMWSGESGMFRYSTWT